MATCSIRLQTQKALFMLWVNGEQPDKRRKLVDTEECLQVIMVDCNMQIMSPAQVSMVHWPAFLEYQIQGWILHKNLLVLFCSTFQGKHDLLDLHICTAKKTSKLENPTRYEHCAGS